MNQPRDLDGQATEISTGLKKLYDLLNEPVARSALDLNQNASTASQYDILRRLRQSLQQYLQRDGDLFYLGFLGHFSAGKSSTINSLLGAWGGENERATDLNPTDQDITLITQQKNSSSLIGVIQQGHVTIRLQTVENPMLDQLVIADTPGTGDPQFIEEVARDFLPICDVILFLLSAANPLDKSDLPLLSELHKRLPFIPVYFVITRSDELRINFNEPITDDNIDPSKRAQFLMEVSDRVNSMLKPQVYLPENFILIDNKSAYNIDFLANFIATRCNSSSPQAHTSMHISKLHFYQSNARELRDFFADFLDTKLVELSKIVAAATKNIQRYQEIVQISNGNLTKAWADSSNDILAARNRCIDPLKALSSLPREPRLFQHVINKRVEISNDIARDARHAANSTHTNLGSQIASALRDHFYDAQKKIGATPLGQLTATEHGITPIPVVIRFDRIETFSSTLLSRRCSDSRKLQADALRDVAGEIKKTVKDFDELMQQKAPLYDCETVIEVAKQSLTEDLIKFFQNVELYRTSVFSHRTKESIATLGIGDQLDKLEADFTNDDKTLLTADAISAMFPGFTEFKAKASTKLNNLNDKLRVLAESVRTLKIDGPEDNFASIEEEAAKARDTFQSELQRLIQADSDRFCAGVASHVANLLINSKTAYDAELLSAGKARRRRYWVIALITAVISGLSYLGYLHSKLAAPTTTVGNIALGVVSGLLVELIVLSIAKWRENVPKMMNKARERYEAKLKEEVRQATDGALRSHDFDSITESAIGQRLNQRYEEIVTTCSEPWKLSATATLQLLSRLQGEYAELRAEYLSLVDEVKNQCVGYFEDSSKNLEVLNKVANRIKELAIVPSFGLLDETRRRLESVKTQVEEVGFL